MIVLCRVGRVDPRPMTGKENEKELCAIKSGNAGKSGRCSAESGVDKYSRVGVLQLRNRKPRSVINCG